jgi:hypothetical protein
MRQCFRKSTNGGYVPFVEVQAELRILATAPDDNALAVVPGESIVVPVALGVTLCIATGERTANCIQ